MKRKVLALILALTMFSALSITAFAAGDATVTFTDGNTLEYTGASGSSLGDAFKGVAPGETKKVEIDVENKNSHTADFYISAGDLEKLETETAKGAGYDVELSVEANGVITSIYNSKLGGYKDKEGAASSDGIEEMKDALDEDILFATLKNGESAKIILFVTFDGEAMGNDYTVTDGQFAFNFKAGYQDPTGTTVIVREVTEDGQVRYVKKIVEIFENAVPLGAVATGDGAMVGLAAVVLLVGASLIILGRKKKVEE